MLCHFWQSDSLVFFLFQVDHLEPWERGSRKTHGQVGMCGGVRGVGAGGIVSSGYCLLFKMFTLKLTKKQVNVLINHPDSPYIRGIGFMFIRYCQHPNTFWEWYEPYLEDDEEIDPKAGTWRRLVTLLFFFCNLFQLHDLWFNISLLEKMQLIQMHEVHSFIWSR